MLLVVKNFKDLWWLNKTIINNRAIHNLSVFLSARLPNLKSINQEQFLLPKFILSAVLSLSSWSVSFPRKCRAKALWVFIKIIYYELVSTFASYTAFVLFFRCTKLIVSHMHFKCIPSFILLFYWMLRTRITRPNTSELTVARVANRVNHPFFAMKQYVWSWLNQQIYEDVNKRGLATETILRTAREKHRI